MATDSITSWEIDGGTAWAALHLITLWFLGPLLSPVTSLVPVIFFPSGQARGHQPWRTVTYGREEHNGQKVADGLHTGHDLLGGRVALGPQTTSTVLGIR